MSQTLESSCPLLWLLKSFDLHVQQSPCSFCSNLQGRSWWSHLIINAGAVELCNRSRHSDYCWSKAFTSSHVLFRPFISLVWKYLESTQKKGKKARVSWAGNTLHHSLTWLVLQAFSLQALNQGVLCWLNRCTMHIAMSHFTTREFGLNTQSLRRVFQLNYLSGCGGCRCPPDPHSSIKGIFILAGGWFLGEWARLGRTITNLWFEALIRWSLSIIARLYSIENCF